MKGQKAHGLIVTLLLVVAVACGSSPTVGSQSSISLDVPDSALPAGVDAKDIRTQVESVFELTEDVQRALGDDYVLSVISLEPDVVQFSQPVTFSMTVESENDAQLRIFNVSSQGAEEVLDFATEFDGSRGVIVVTGEITHFSDLVASKSKALQTAKELVARGRAKVAHLTAKAEGSTFWSEKAKFYKQAVDAALEVQAESFARFPDSPDIPEFGKNSYDESSNMQKYAEFITKEYDNLISNEPDPFARFDLLQKRGQITSDIHDFWVSDLGEVSEAPTAGGDDLGETTALVEQGDLILKEIEDLINNEPDVAKANDLRAKLSDVISYLGQVGLEVGSERELGGHIAQWDKIREQHQAISETSIQEFTVLFPPQGPDTDMYAAQILGFDVKPNWQYTIEILPRPRRLWVRQSEKLCGDHNIFLIHDCGSFVEYKEEGLRFIAGSPGWDGIPDSYEYLYPTEGQWDFGVSRDRENDNGQHYTITIVGESNDHGTGLDDATPITFGKLVEGKFWEVIPNVDWFTFPAQEGFWYGIDLDFDPPSVDGAPIMIISPSGKRTIYAHTGVYIIPREMEETGIHWLRMATTNSSISLSYTISIKEHKSERDFWDWLDTQR